MERGVPWRDAALLFASGHTLQRGRCHSNHCLRQQYNRSFTTFRKIHLTQMQRNVEGVFQPVEGLFQCACPGPCTGRHLQLHFVEKRLSEVVVPLHWQCLASGAERLLPIPGFPPQTVHPEGSREKRYSSKTEPCLQGWKGVKKFTVKQWI